MRPRGTPPTPSARSSAIDPVGITSTVNRVACPRRMIAPLPNCFSILLRAISSAFCFSMTFLPLRNVEVRLRNEIKRLNDRVLGTFRLEGALHQDEALHFQGAQTAERLVGGDTLQGAGSGDLSGIRLDTGERQMGAKGSVFASESLFDKP